MAEETRIKDLPDRPGGLQDEDRFPGDNSALADGFSVSWAQVKAALAPLIQGVFLAEDGQGEITALDQALIDPAGAESAGKWYFNRVAGTHTGTNPAGAIENGGYTYSDGTQWKQRGPSPTVILDGQIVESMLADEVAQKLAHIYVYASEELPGYNLPLVDEAGNIGAWIDDEGNFNIADLEPRRINLGDESTITLIDDGVWQFAIMDAAGFVLYGVDEEGNMVPDFRTYFDTDGRFEVPGVTTPSLTIGEAGELLALETDAWLIAACDAAGYVSWGIRPDGTVLPEVSDGDGGTEDGEIEAIRWYAEIGDDPSRELVVNWHSFSAGPAVLEYRVAGASSWQSAGGGTRAFPHRDEYIHSVRLRNLSPDTIYEVRTPGSGSLDTRKVRTLPEVWTRDLRIVVASDIQEPSRTYFRQLNAQVAGLNPDLGLLLGDYPPDDGVQGEDESAAWADIIGDISARWVRASDGCMIPVATIAGNHEVPQADPFSGAGAPAYMTVLFTRNWVDHWDTSGGAGYGYFTVGKQLLVVMLDTHHVSDIHAQIAWADALLTAQGAQFRHVLLCTHMSPFSPSYFWDYEAGKALRRDLFPIVQEHPNLLHWLVAHEHLLMFTPRLKVLDDETDELENRWFADAAGLRVIGGGGWGAPSTLTLNDEDRVSGVDASSYLEAMLSTVAVVGSITPISAITGAWTDPAPKHILLTTLKAAAIETKAIAIDGTTYYTVEDNLPT